MSPVDPLNNSTIELPTYNPSSTEHGDYEKNPSSFNPFFSPLSPLPDDKRSTMARMPLLFSAMALEPLTPINRKVFPRSLLAHSLGQ